MQTTRQNCTVLVKDEATLNSNRKTIMENVVEDISFGGGGGLKDESDRSHLSITPMTQPSLN